MAEVAQETLIKEWQVTLVGSSRADSLHIFPVHCERNSHTLFILQKN